MSTITQKQVAQRAAVSRSTVKDVVTGNPRVSEATRQRVLEAMQALNYRPNLAARELIGRRSRTGSRQEQPAVIDLWWNLQPSPIHAQFHEAANQQFRQGHPDIKVQVRKETECPDSEVMDRLLLALATRPSPVCHYVSHPHLNKFARLGLCADLTSLVDEWEDREQYIDAAWDVVRFDGRIIGIPTERASIQVLHYNRRRFSECGLNEPPATWEEALEAARRLTQPAKRQYGLSLGAEEYLPYFFVDILYQFGGRLARRKGGRVVLALEEEPALKALRFVHDLRWKYQVLSPHIRRTDGENVQDLNSGAVAMTIGMAADYHTSPQLSRPEIGIASLPGGPTGKRFCQLGIGAWIINAQCTPAQQRAAWEYLKFQTSKSTALLWWHTYRQQGVLRPLTHTFRNFPGATEANAELPADWQQTIKETMRFARLVTYPTGYEFEILHRLLLRLFANPDIDLREEVRQCAREYGGGDGAFA